MKHIVMIKRGAGPAGTLRPGKVYSVDDSLAEALVNPKSVDPDSEHLPFARYARPEEITDRAPRYEHAVQSATLRKTSGGRSGS